MKQEHKPIRWLYLAVGTVVLLFAGIVYAWSILKAPLAEEFGWTASQLTLNFTLTMCFFCLGGMLAGVLLKKLGFRVTTILSGVLACLGFVLAGGVGQNVVLLYLSYGLLAGLGIGMTYNCIISTVSAWFADKKGLCSGVLMMGFGASALILGSLANSLIAAPAVGWRMTYRVIGFALGVVLMLAALVLRRPEAPQGAAKQAVGGEADAPPAQMLRSANFWKAFLCIVFLCAMGNTVISMARDLALSVGAAAQTATLLVGLLSVCNGLGRVITGAVFDKLGRRSTMIAANILTICAAGVTLLSIVTGSVALCVAGLCLTGLSYGTCPTISSAFTSEMFGQRFFSMNFPIMNCNLIFASFIATGASKINEASGGYATSFILLLALCVVALLLNFSIRERKKD